MKLYTEEQVREAYEIGVEDGDCGEYREDIEMLNLTPIQILNYEKLWEEFRIEYPNTIYGFKEQYKCFIWIINKILNK